ncbi:MAG: FAD-dependent oxidoreductase [Sulfolobales archaeon]
MVEKYDVIVVGAGVGGSSAAYYLAKKGYNVILLEKAHVPGQRNVTGGVIYIDYLEGFGLKDLFPKLIEEAPLERKITKYRLWMLSKEKKINGEYRYKFLDLSETFLDKFIHGEALKSEGYSVLRAKFDKWLASKVVDAGGIVVTDATAESLIKENNKVIGVRTHKEEIYADLVIDASGVTSTLVIDAGLRGYLGPEDVYHGIKHVYELGEGDIEQRFGLKKGEGVAIAVTGDFMYGAKGGGFIYTNKNTISIGIVVDMKSMLEAIRRNIDKIGKPLDMLEEMEAHPEISKLIEGAKLVEYSAHNVPKGRRVFLKKPYTSGYLVIGDALGAFVKIGAMIDGMRRAVATGLMAAKTYEYARSRGKFDESTLSLYAELLKPVAKDIERYRRESIVSESSLVYGFGYKLGLSILGKTRSANKLAPRDTRDAIQRVQSRTSLLLYKENKEYIHIDVDYEKASRDPHKFWVVACPVNCYTIVVEGKGIFASFKDLYNYNLEYFKKTKKNIDPAEVLNATWRDIEKSTLRFDHVACVECGTCWFIGPPNVIRFHHQRDGKGVKFAYG